MHPKSTPRTAPATSPPKRAALYCRVSTDDQQDGYGPAIQESECRHWALANGYTVATVAHETFSGKAIERPKFDALLEAGRAGAFEAVLCHTQDRLGRGSEVIAVMLYRLSGAGLDVVCVREPFEAGEMGAALRALRGMASGLELEAITRRTQEGRKARARAGKLTPCRAPLFGYQWRGNAREAFDVDPDTAPTVRRIFQELLAGRTLRAVAKGLDADGIPTPQGGARWLHTTVRKIAANERYTGGGALFVKQTEKVLRGEGAGRYRRVAGGEAAAELPAGVVPPLVSREAWARVAEQLTRNQREHAGRPHGHPEFFLLRGRVSCATCGRALQAIYISQGQAIYRASDHPNCPTTAIPAHVVDGEAWALAGRIMDEPERVIARLHADAGPDPTIDRRRAVDAAHADAERRAATLARRMGEVPDSLFAALVVQLEAAQGEQRALEEQREALDAERATWETRAARADEVQAWIERARAKLEVFTTPILTQGQIADLRAAGVEYSDDDAAFLTTPRGTPAGDLDLALLDVTQYAFKMQRERTPPSFEERREIVTMLGIRAAVGPVGHQPRRVTLTTDTPLLDPTTGCGAGSAGTTPRSNRR